MPIFRFLCFVLGFLVLQSCVSKKKLTYLQKKQDEQAYQIDSIAQLRMTQKPYRIQIGDMLSIRVKALDPELVNAFNPIGQSQLNATTEERVYFDGFTVDRQGEIEVPVLGKLKVIGLTLEEIEKKLEKRLLDEYFKDTSNVFVTVKLPGIPYTTIGEFGSTGSKVIYKEKLTIMEAIANSGDITLTGDRQNVIVFRQYPTGVKRHTIDLTNIDAINSPYYYVKPNDLIVVNPLPQKSLGLGTNAFGTLSSLISLAISLTVIALRL
ncbi:polysaccharide biosynthesis/export family protein [Flavobacterium sp. CS20]|uniref:polysaccharide biosynthesis/export family protein n=1 Tax=Flavobacterium sp. CS20 TaxID=2775246 RepID=UPI001B3A02DA|nr:polysaccharide biosynthesis/export family protein [Flavobacterium sp. CS20]QTY27696.1 polysaccharide biosynthesis/export family protein [Flavobacterium sp. CS20]